MVQNDSFSGYVIYIDLRGYTKIVEEKTLNNIAQIIYKSAKTIKTAVQNILKLEKEKYTNLDSIDFGMAISHSTIYQKNIIDDDKSNSRKMFFGVSLNRAAKIGDKMNSNKNHIGIDKPMYDDFLVNLLVKENMIKGTDPIVHMYSKHITKPSSERIA